MSLKHKTLGELFDACAQLTKPADKVALLQANNGTGLQYFLRLAFSDVVWTLPDGLPPYKPDKAPFGYTPSHLLRELRVLYLFLEDPDAPSKIDQHRREQLFQQLLERLHTSEVAVLASLKDKTFTKTYKVTRAIVNTAFPTLLDQPLRVRLIR